MSVQTVEYEGWKDCLELSNDAVRLVLSTQFGPRILSYRRHGGPELLGLSESERGQLAAPGEWRLYGGHRLWHAPEARPRSYSPDNQPLQVKIESPLAVSLVQAVEAETGIRKRLELRLDPSSSALEIRHVLHNESLWSLRCAPWAITVMRAGGVAFAPLPAGSPGALQAVGNLALWSYSHLNDPRLQFGRRCLRVEQRASDSAFKIGVGGAPGWLAYALEGELFVKRFDAGPGEYADCGSRAEIYTNASVLELESLAPLQSLQPGEEAVHLERWELFAAAVAPSVSELDEGAAFAHLWGES